MEPHKVLNKLKKILTLFEKPSLKSQYLCFYTLLKILNNPEQ